MAWRQQGNPLSFFPGFTRKKDERDLLSCHQDMILFSSCANTVVKQLQECITPWYSTQTTNNALRRTDNLAKRQPANSLSFFSGFTWKKDDRDLLRCHHTVILFCPCANTLGKHQLAPLLSPMDTRLLQSSVHGAAPIDVPRYLTQTPTLTLRRTDGQTI